MKLHVIRPVVFDIGVSAHAQGSDTLACRVLSRALRHSEFCAVGTYRGENSKHDTKSSVHLRMLEAGMLCPPHGQTQGAYHYVLLLVCWQDLLASQPSFALKFLQTWAPAYPDRGTGAAVSIYQ